MSPTTSQSLRGPPISPVKDHRTGNDRADCDQHRPAYPYSLFPVRGVHHCRCPSRIPYDLRGHVQSKAGDLPALRHRGIGRWRTPKGVVIGDGAVYFVVQQSDSHVCDRDRRFRSRVGCATPLTPSTDFVATLGFPVVSTGFADRRRILALHDGVSDRAQCRDRHLDHVPRLERLRRALTGTAPQLP
jgi:hypothetical protein